MGNFIICLLLLERFGAMDSLIVIRCQESRFNIRTRNRSTRPRNYRLHLCEFNLVNRWIYLKELLLQHSPIHTTKVLLDCHLFASSPHQPCDNYRCTVCVGGGRITVNTSSPAASPPDFLHYTHLPTRTLSQKEEGSGMWGL